MYTTVGIKTHIVHLKLNLHGNQLIPILACQYLSAVFEILPDNKVQ